MKFFIDTADVAEIRDLAATGLVDGVTTNPSLVAKSGRKFLDVVREICDIVPGPVSAEVTATDHATMLQEGRKLAKLAKNVTVKVPLTPDGLKTCKALSGDGTELYIANEAGWLEVRSIATLARLDSIPLAGPAFGLARSPDDAVLYAGLYTIGRVAVINRATRQVIKTLATGGNPRRIAFTADGRHAVIANLAGWVDVVTR